MAKIKASIIENSKIYKITMQKNSLPFLVFIYLLIHEKNLNLFHLMLDLRKTFNVSEEQINSALLFLEFDVSLIKSNLNLVEIVNYSDFISDQKEEKYIYIQEDFFENGEYGKVREIIKNFYGLEVIELWILNLLTIALYGENIKIKNVLD
ncbi:MAG: hypothetical protein ACYDDE_03950 [bacterium]